MPLYYFHSVSCSGIQTCADLHSLREGGLKGLQEGQLVPFKKDLTDKSNFPSSLTKKAITEKAF